MEDPLDGPEGSTWLLQPIDRRQVDGRLLVRSCLWDSNSSRPEMRRSVGCPGLDHTAWARDRLTPLLGKLEATGRCNAYNIGDYHDPFVTRLWEFGIESVYAVSAKPGTEGMVIVQAGTYGGRGWDRQPSIGGEFTEQEEDGPMKHMGWIAMLYTEAHPVGGVPGRAGDPEACGGFDAKADRI